MGTIANARASFGLQAAGTPTGTNVAGSVTIGQAQLTDQFTDADIAYSFKVDSTGSSDAVSLGLTLGAATATNGSPTITDADGKDFEGDTLSSLTGLYGVLVRTDSDNSGVVAITGPSIVSGLAAGNSMIYSLATTPTSISTQALDLTFNSSGDSVTVTIIGKSS